MMRLFKKLIKIDNKDIYSNGANNSMDRLGPTGKVSKKRIHLLRWSSFPGRTVWNFGSMDRAPCIFVNVSI